MNIIKKKTLHRPLYPENDALARMDEMLAIINDEIMDALADIVVECVLNYLVTY